MNDSRKFANCDAEQSWSGRTTELGVWLTSEASATFFAVWDGVHSNVTLNQEALLCRMNPRPRNVPEQVLHEEAHLTSSYDLLCVLRCSGTSIPRCDKFSLRKTG